MKDHLSKRGRHWVKDMSPLMNADFSTRNNRYDPELRPEGYINMGTAETHLINDQAIALLTKIHSRRDIVDKEIHYDYFHGSDEFRTAISEYWTKLVFGENGKAKFTKENVAIGAGCSLALEMLAQVLGDPGDVFLVLAPYYSGFIDDIHDRAGVQPVGVPCAEKIDRAVLDRAFEEQTKLGKNVKAVLFSSPNNPTGKVYPAEEIQELISFCIDRDIDLIADEIYAQTIHDPAAHWVGTLSLVPDSYREHVHMTTSFAKDFALSGFRTGFVLSFNEDMLRAMRGLSYYSAVSTHNQALLTDLLRAPELPDLIKENTTALHKAYLLMKDCLKEMGIPMMEAQGGIFIFADFNAYLKKKEFEEEYTLWREIFDGLKVNISPGQLFDAPTPGWFRICYAHPPAVVDEACRRLKTLKLPE